MKIEIPKALEIIMKMENVVARFSKNGNSYLGKVQNIELENNVLIVKFKFLKRNDKEKLARPNLLRLNLADCEINCIEEVGISIFSTQTREVFWFLPNMF